VRLLLGFYTYADRKVPFEQLSRRYPFIGAEMVAQNFDATYLPRFQNMLANPKLRPALVRQGLAT